MKGLLLEILRDTEAGRVRTILGGEMGWFFAAGAGPHECLTVSGSTGNVPGVTRTESCRDAA